MKDIKRNSSNTAKTCPSSNGDARVTKKNGRRAPRLNHRRATTKKTKLFKRAGAPKPNGIEIAKALDALFDKADIIEPHALHKSPKRTDAGYSDGAHRAKLIKEAKRLNTAGAAV